jgi:hypothetical protein
MSVPGEAYLGDAVYASCDGCQIRLVAHDNEIFLEPETLQALLAYVKKLRDDAMSKPTPGDET